MGEVSSLVWVFCSRFGTESLGVPCVMGEGGVRGFVSGRHLCSG